MKIIILLIFISIFSVKAFATDPPMQLYDEGVYLGTVFRLNCVGDGVVCTKSGITGIITVSSVTPPSGSALTFLTDPLTFDGSALTFTP